MTNLNKAVKDMGNVSYQKMVDGLTQTVASNDQSVLKCKVGRLTKTTIFTKDGNKYQVETKDRRGTDIQIMDLNEVRTTLEFLTWGAEL